MTLSLIWTLTQESVRVAATALVRTLRGLTLRMADPDLTPAADAAAAIKAALPLLLAKGESSPRSLGSAESPSLCLT